MKHKKLNSITVLISYFAAVVFVGSNTQRFSKDFCIFSLHIFPHKYSSFKFSYASQFSVFTVNIYENTSYLKTFRELPFHGLQCQYNVSFQLLCSLHFALVAFQLYIFTFCKLESGYCFLSVQTSPRSSVWNPML